MNRERIKAYIVIFSGIFILLLSITWQQVVIFRLGYRLTDLKEQIRTEEIKKQRIMEKFHFRSSLFNIEQRAKKSFNMGQPDPEKCRILKIDNEKLFHKGNRKRVSFVAYLKEILSPSDAEAK